MAKFNLELPTDIINDIEKINRNADDIFGEMTRAGAEVVARNVKASVPIPEIAGHVKLSKTYKTPSDGGINTKVYFSGYLPFKGNRKNFVRRGGGKSSYSTDKGVPAEFLAQVSEYGSSERYTDLGWYRGKIAKRPFFRKSFKESQITKAMLKVQKEKSGGLLDE